MENLDLNENNSEDEPIQIDNLEENDSQNSQVSHSPLDLGGPAAPAKPAKKKTNQPASKPTPSPAPAAGAVPAPTVSAPVAAGERITNVKTFFSKLHAGAIDFLNNQIAEWLQNNPDIVVKRTNVVTGDVVSKKTEPNILYIIWY